MTRDEEVALVARIAAGAVATGQCTIAGSAEIALQIIEHAQQAVDAKRGGEKDWERLDAAARVVVDWWDTGDLTVALDSHSQVVGVGRAIREMREALAALQPEEPKS